MNIIHVITIFPIIQEEVFPVLHTCPYKEDVMDDHESLCNCDDEYTNQCARDI